MTDNTKAGAQSASLMPPLLFAVALVTSTFVWWTVALPVLGGNFGSHASHSMPLYVHTIGGTLMLVAGSAAIFIGWTRRGFRFHKLLGYAYLLGGTTASIAAIGLNAINPHGDVSIAFATSTLAAVWLAAGAMAWRAIRNRRIDTHREWMVRSYVLTWTFVLCRIVQNPEINLVSGDLTADVIWTAWVLPLVICEIVLQWRRGSSSARS